MELVDRSYTKSYRLFHKINKLTVVNRFIKRFRVGTPKRNVVSQDKIQANEHFFEGNQLFDTQESRITLSKDQARDIYKYLLSMIN